MTTARVQKYEALADGTVFFETSTSNTAIHFSTEPVSYSVVQYDSFGRTQTTNVVSSEGQDFSAFPSADGAPAGKYARTVGDNTWELVDEPSGGGGSGGGGSVFVGGLSDTVNLYDTINAGDSTTSNTDTYHAGAS